MRSRPLSAGVLAAAVAAALLGGCGSGDAWSEPHALPTPVGTLGPGFVDPTAPPSPEATVAPRPGSWDGVHPPEDYRVVLLTSGDDAPTATLVDAVRTWADAEDVDLRTLTAHRSDDLVPRITDALGMRPDLVISAGDALIDPLALVSANHLDQQFLVVGAELAEPTGNVTAADWAGASFRGEGLGASSTYDPATFTPARAAQALRAGVAAVLTGNTGIVLWLP
ncbi:hypothetical protein EDD29_1771 [Actinocorallia herbida]|uniref:BMP family ABC transporter substrate-binding protein n=1 Tax=Actinocorallia herbida TaxID=58109 RepID=A0A3N1CSF6_9ACTN|nr:hypothetical protein [Actinocorallia herbida]ROO84251.1 hypothetical protein EDD29_1771 [Actinocorallia herbida]